MTAMSSCVAAGAGSFGGLDSPGPHLDAGSAEVEHILAVPSDLRGHHDLVPRQVFQPAPQHLVHRCASETSSFVCAGRSSG